MGLKKLVKYAKESSMIRYIMTIKDYHFPKREFSTSDLQYLDPSVAKKILECEEEVMGLLNGENL